MRALIIEDEKSNQLILKQFLTAFGQTSIANHGEEGLELFKKSLDDELPFDLICLDIMMPGLDGNEVLRRIRQEEAERGILGLSGSKIIMITAVVERAAVIDAFRDGCEAYLIKPLKRDDLIRNLKTLKLIPSETKV